jgi:glucokinase
MAAPEGPVAVAAGTDEPAGEHLVEAARRGDGESVRDLEEAGRWLGTGIASLVTVLDPDVVVVGGAVSAAGELLLGPARAVIPAFLSGAVHRAPTPVVGAAFGAQSGLVGAGLRAEELA